MAVTLICIDIPVCRPLYKKYLDHLTSKNTSSRYNNISGGAMPLRTTGGGEIPAGVNGTGLSANREEKGESLGPAGDDRLRGESSLGKGSDPFEGASDEEALSDSWKGQSPGEETGIRVTKEVTISRQ